MDFCPNVEQFFRLKILNWYIFIDSMACNVWWIPSKTSTFLPSRIQRTRLLYCLPPHKTVASVLCGGIDFWTFPPQSWEWSGRFSGKSPCWQNWHRRGRELNRRQNGNIRPFYLVMDLKKTNGRNFLQLRSSHLYLTQIAICSSELLRG